MPNVPIFPKEDGASSDHHPLEKGEETPFKRPEFIIIDPRQGKNSDSSQKPNNPFQSQKEEPQSSKSPISLRFLCVLGLIFCLIFGLGILIWSIALTFLAALSLFRNQNLNQGVRSFWKLYTNTVITGLGFALGIISPTIGLGLIVLYFSVTGEIIENSILHKVIKRSFNNF